MHMLFCLIISCIASSLHTENLPVNDNSFSFTMHNKEVSLINPNKYIQKKKYHKILVIDQEINQGQWYYVHFYINDISDIQKYISIRNEDELLKHTYILFLFPNQLTKIANISVVKKIEPNEKYAEYGGPLESADFLTVFTSPKFKIPILNENYIIENIKNDNLNIIKFVQNQLNTKEYVQIKKKIIQILSEIPEIKSISTYRKPIQENALMTGFTQKNNFDFKFNNISNFYYLDRYLNNNGITGKDQVITIMDTPIDFYHAMFRDDNVDFKLNTYMPNHRKIVYYTYNGDLNNLTKTIDENEHGTHVAGIAAGKSICSNDEQKISLLNGNAPDAKIFYAGHFFDFDSNKLTTDMKKYNSRISSNSWGTETPYNYRNFEFGQMAAQNPNLIFICSSGNYYQKYGNFSIGDPKSSKNVLAVGSLDDFYVKISIYNISYKDHPDFWFLAQGMIFLDPWFVGSLGTVPGESDILVLDVDKGNQCNLINQNKYILLYGNDINWYYDCNFNSYHQVIYSPNEFRPYIEKLLSLKADVLVNKIFMMDKTSKITRASYSSTGPGNKGILKPDVMAPGTNIISAKSRNQSSSSHGCRDDNERDFIMISGTSMATPNVAGGAVLIHDYFLSGKWIDKVSLDGATTRALIINSCRHPLDSKSPDIIYGHGTVDLSTIIPIEKDFGVQITHQDKRPFVTNNGHKMSKIKVNSTSNKRDLQITLSYLDTMLNMDSPIPITRDLDLVVVSPSQKVFLGDHLANGDSQHLSTNEKVIIKYNELEDGEYKIHVYSSNFIDLEVPNESQNQEFSVVASGPISNGYIDFSDSSECPCDKCNKKQQGFCICNESTELGPICQSKIETVYGTSSAFYVDTLEIKHVKFISPKKIKYLTSKSKNPGKNSTIWIDKTCHYTLGEYEINGQTTIDGSRIKIKYGTKEICVAIFNNNDLPANYLIDVTNIPKYEIFWILNIVLIIIILVLSILLGYFLCCRKKCCNKNKQKTSESVSQFSLNESLIDN